MNLGVIREMDSMLYAFLRELATMTNQRFINFAKFKVQQWLGHNDENMDGISTDDIFVVWYSKTLQNHKALLGTHFTNHYFECTFNGDKGEMYMDVYDKVQNVCVKVTQLNAV